MKVRQLLVAGVRRMGQINHCMPNRPARTLYINFLYYQYFKQTLLHCGTVPCHLINLTKVQRTELTADKRGIIANE